MWFEFGVHVGFAETQCRSAPLLGQLGQRPSGKQGNGERTISSVPIFLGVQSGSNKSLRAAVMGEVGQGGSTVSDCLPGNPRLQLRSGRKVTDFVALPRAGESRGAEVLR